MKNKTSINRKSNTGAVERETKVHDKEGDIMAIATRDVISIPEMLFPFLLQNLLKILQK